MHKRLYLFYNQILRRSLLIVLLILSMKNSTANIYPQLPDSIDGWTAGEQNLLNDRKSLYDYIDGGAELYISYGFTSALSRKYIKSDQPDVVVEIFNMLNSKNAYGVFSHARYEEDYTFGQGSQYIGGVLFFWKNNFFVSIMTTEETDESKKLINDLGWIISEMIKGEGDKPEIIDLLPLNGLEKAGVLGDTVFKKATALINVRPMRTHNWSGVGSLIKNYIRFAERMPDYHPDSCADLAKLYELPHVKGKTRLNILVMFTPLFHGVGAHHFSKEFIWPYKGLVVSLDPVAADSVGLQIINAKRKEFFGEDKPLNPPAKHIYLADTRHHLGNADPKNIELIKLGFKEGSFI